MNLRALVLSGGGPRAIAWETGFLAGLAQCGVDAGRADLVLGTSAGAYVGVQIAAGLDPVELADTLTRRRAAQPTYAPEALARLPALFGKAQGGDAVARAEVGAIALAASTESEPDYVAGVAARLPPALTRPPRAWPAAFGCTVVDAHSGAFTMLAADCGADPCRAVAASCSLPGLDPPVDIGGRHYMDGGMRSATNADQALGHAIVLVLAFQPGGPVGERMGVRVRREVAVLCEAGAKVEIVTPDEATLAALGPQALSMECGPEVVRCAIEQGCACAPGLTGFWNAR